VAEFNESADAAFEVLNQYLERLQQGDYPDRKKLLAEHPELAPALKCLDALEALAPAGPPPSTDALTETIEAGADGTPSGGKSTVEILRRLGDFGDYELQEEIGRGGMGVVYKARQRSLDRTVAVKMIASLLASRDQVRRFQAEAKAAAGINHPHVVQIYEVGEIFGQHYFAMEYVAGTTLAKRLETERQNPAAERLSPEEAASLTAAVAHAVECLHRHGIVHRDLKPSNILLDAEGKPKVTDFGLAKPTGRGSRDEVNGVIAGTPPYMSPEQAAGKVNQIGPASDVYSLGAILYELLTGRPPFRGDNPLDVLAQVQQREPPLPRQVNPRLPHELEIICMKCLEKAPAERYASAGALAEDLERYLRRETIEATPPSLVQRVWRWARREPALASRVGALSLFWAVLAFMFGWFDLKLENQHEFFWRVTLIVGIWIAASLVFQRMLARRRWETTARFLWGMVDALLLLAVLLSGDGVASPMVIGLPLLIVAAGLWSQVRLVWFVSATCVAAYGVLVAKYYGWLSLGAAKSLRPFDDHPDRHIYFLISLILCGCLVAYQVSRTRALNRYFERRRL
jgi:tRNA A-37 threonylcarbamoyl transferase component Bud32